MSEDKKTLPMFRCDRLHATLSEQACARRWELAQFSENALVSCKRCVVGERHAGGGCVSAT